MKHFKIIGEKTTREFDIEDDEMISWNVIKIKDYEKPIHSMDEMIKLNCKTQNERIYDTATKEKDE